MKKTWKIINELSSRNFNKSKRIPKVVVGEQELTSSNEIAEAFNNYFLTLEKTLLLK